MRGDTRTGLWAFLLLLTGTDFILSLLILIVSVTAGWPASHGSQPGLNELSGMANAVWSAQTLVRLVLLGLMAAWTGRLSANARRVGKFPVSAPWDWIGWFLPVFGYWLPVRPILAINPPKNRPLILAWWCTRLLTCPSGALVLRLLLPIMSLTQKGGNTDGVLMDWIGWVSLAGLVSSALAIPMLIATQQNRPKRGKGTVARVF
ncbi:hypothetical protein AEAC466_01570 [Asticcacaulis sp. AC466]|uniref:hypothetical protein n=1 Tax=Asticcacaulis sp. AC466 TaxID=1282362 RepID=UPI0003C3B37C|nr:hypothetical protein [Asticcacaulis sp. AC466]ESQ85895.1 hypothetical protein AEAC466_01570 [Asticcacaulis sp. AC466]